MISMHEANRRYWNGAAERWESLRAEDSRFWQDSTYLPGADETLSDWPENPRAALPVWLTVALQRRLRCKERHSG